jgi:hypothetical protein
MTVLLQQAECMLQVQICEEEIRAYALLQPTYISLLDYMDVPSPSGPLSPLESRTRLPHVSWRAQ